MQGRKTFYLDANASHFLLQPSLCSSSRSRTEQVGTGGGLNRGQMSSDRRPCAPSSRRDEAVRFQHRTLTLTLIYPQGPAAWL